MSQSLLSIMAVVKDFTWEILEYGRISGFHKGNIETYSQVVFNEEYNAKGDKEETVIPDGAIIIKRGDNQWTALVEVKTGSDTFNPQQIKNNLKIAHKYSYDAVITISNYISVDGEHPNQDSIDMGNYGNVHLYHISWASILLIAKKIQQSSRVTDPEQAWILDELIHYLSAENSGVSLKESSRMGEHWTEICQAVRERTFRSDDKGAYGEALHFQQILERTALEIAAAHNTKATVASKETKSYLRELDHEGILKGIIKVDGLISEIAIIADIRSERIEVSYNIDAALSQKTKNTTRIKWLLQQLEDFLTSETKNNYKISIEAKHKHQRSAGRKDILSENLIKYSDRLLTPDQDTELKTFIVSLQGPLNLSSGNRGRAATGRKNFTYSIIDSTLDSITHIGKHIKIPAYKPAPAEAASRENQEHTPETTMLPIRHQYTPYQNIKLDNWTQSKETQQIIKKAQPWTLPAKIETDLDEHRNPAAINDPNYIYGTPETGQAPIGNAIGRISAAHEFQQQLLPQYLNKLQENGAQNIGYFKSSRINTNILEIPYPYITEENQQTQETKLFHPDWYIYYMMNNKPHLLIIEMTKDDNKDKIIAKTQALKQWIEHTNQQSDNSYKVYGMMIKVNNTNSISDIETLGGVLALHHR